MSLHDVSRGLRGNGLVSGLVSHDQPQPRHARRHHRRSRPGSPSRRGAPSAAFEALEDRRLMAVGIDTVFLANQKSGIPVSNSDLINGLLPSSTNYVRSFEGGEISNLTDGKTAVTAGNTNEFSAQGNAVFSLDPGIPADQRHGPFWFAEYNLPTTGAPVGWNLTQIDSITGHQDNRTNQTIKVFVKFFGQSTFTPLNGADGTNTFSYRPDLGNGAARLRIVDESSTTDTPPADPADPTNTQNANNTGAAMAQGVIAVRVEFDQQAVYRELDVLGTATPQQDQPPAAPTNLTGTAANGQVNLSFVDNANNENGFQLERATVVNGVAGAFAPIANLPPKTSPATGGTVNYTDTTVELGKTYQYRVRAFNNAQPTGTSAYATSTNIAVPTTGQGARAAYFPVQFWKGNETVVQLDGDLSDNAYGAGSPHPSIPVDNFSTMFTGKITPTVTGSYLFRGQTDDQGYLAVEGRQFEGGGLVQTVVTAGPGQDLFVHLTAGESYDFAFYQNEIGGDATANFLWDPEFDGTFDRIPASVLSPAMDAPQPVEDSPGSPRASAAPTGVSGFASTPFNVGVNFSNNARNATELRLERAVLTNGVPGAFTTVAEDLPNASSLTDTTARPNTSYRYRVVAVNPTGSVTSTEFADVTTPARDPDATGASGTWFSSGFWGASTRPASLADVAVRDQSPDYYEDVFNVEYSNPSLDRNGIGTTEGGANGQGNYSTVFSGKIVINTGGDYKFISNTDDDGILYVNGQVVSFDPNGHGPRDADDPANPFASSVVTVNLQPGEYDFVFLHAEQGGGSDATMKYEGPDTGGTRTVIPNSALKRVATFPVAPGAGTADTATATTAALTWTDPNKSEWGYKIVRSLQSNFATIEETNFAGINSTSFTDTDLTPGTTYHYRITGYNLEGESTALVTSVTTPSTNTAPTAPTGAAARAVRSTITAAQAPQYNPPSARAGRTILNWTDTANNETSYAIQRREGAAGTFTTIATDLPANATTYTDNASLTNGQTYTYRIIARNAVGDGFTDINVVHGGAGGTGLTGVGYDDRDVDGNGTIEETERFQDNPATADPYTAIDPEIGENFSLGPWIAGQQEDQFSVKWTGQVQAEKTEAYTFIVSGDDATSLRITSAADGSVLADIPLAGGERSSTPVNLTAGQRYNIEMRMYEGTGGASAFLEWSSTTTPREIIPQTFLFATQGPSGPVVVDRHVFYDKSSFDGTTSQVADGPNDDAAVDPNKEALRPGQQAGDANYSNYDKGINGIMVDISTLTSAQLSGLSASDFEFRVGNDNTPGDWALAPAPTSVTGRDGAGANGTDRVMIKWANNAIRKTWLQVTVKANANTGLSAPDVFYFGNLPGDTFNGATTAGVYTVNSIDLQRVRNAQFQSASSLTSPNTIYDVNKSGGNINSIDLQIVRNNQFQSINRITPEAAAAVASTTSSSSSPASVKLAGPTFASVKGAWSAIDED